MVLWLDDNMKFPILFLIISMLFLGCVSNEPESQSNTNSSIIELQNKSNNITVEIYHFHGTHQCYSCIKVGELAEKTVNTYFKNELESGKIVFAHINGELLENQALVNKYGVTGSSIWIGTYVNGKFSKEQNINVWYKIDNEADYLAYFKGILEKRLTGELN